MIHKHKKFSKCATCLYYKEVIGRETDAVVRQLLRTERKAHHAQQYEERVTYYARRNAGRRNPGYVLSGILDGATQNNTSLPMFHRSTGAFPSEFEPLSNQFYGFLVHGSEGLLGYTVDESTIKGGNLTCEILYRSFWKIQRTRLSAWPKVFMLQLDSTCSDNKNNSVLYFLAWLVACETFDMVYLSFLLVGECVPLTYA